MPAQKAAGQAGPAPLAATDATPLSQERIEGLAPRELTPEEKEKAEADKEAREEAADAAKAAAQTAAPAVNVPGRPPAQPGEKAGEPAQTVPPSPDEAPPCARRQRRCRPGTAPSTPRPRP